MILLNKATFDPGHTFTCGQCFRWWREGSVWRGLVKGALLEVKELDDEYSVEVLVGSMSDMELEIYFDQFTDYEEITRYLSQKDQWLQASTVYGKGIRVLRQDPFEMLLTFILSSNNNIPKIKLSIEDLSLKFGAPILYEGAVYYGFPLLEDLAGVSVEGLTVRAAGYRSISLKKTVDRLLDEGLDLAVPFGLSYDEGKAWLKGFHGVGDKVADCVLLFGYAKTEAFPVDTWVKRMLRELYGVSDSPAAYAEFVGRYFSVYGGFAQQYLFHYMRSKYSKRGEL